jgi:hypothetical protein
MENMAQTMNKKDSNMGNDAAARKKVYGGGSMNRKGYKHGKMVGCQPTYSEDMPKAKAN